MCTAPYKCTDTQKNKHAQTDTHRGVYTVKFTERLTDAQRYETHTKQAHTWRHMKTYKQTHTDLKTYILTHKTWRDIKTQQGHRDI